jgi:hypothetical protein
MTPRPTTPDESPDAALEPFEHPRGTLVIVLVFGLLFALGWLGMYLFVFLGRGALHP